MQVIIPVLGPSSPPPSRASASDPLWLVSAKRVTDANKSIV